MNALTNPVPDGTILVHIGPHKTGTTSLQHATLFNRKQALQQGVYYAVPDDRRSASNQEARSLMKLPFAGEKVIDYSVWEAQVSRVTTSTAPRIFVSGEEFSFCQPKEIRTLLSDFGRERVQIVVTARSIERVLPSQWQLDLRGGHTRQPFDKWLRETLRPRRIRTAGARLGIPHPFWFRHRHDQLAERWAAEVGADQVTVVISDDRNHRVQLGAFESLLGLSEGLLVPPVGNTNASLDRDEAAALVKVYELCHERGLTLTRAGRKGLMRYLQVQRAGRPTGSLIDIPGWATKEVQGIATSIHDGLLRSAVRIVGDPSILLGAHAPVGVNEELAGVDVAEAAEKEFDVLVVNGWVVPNSKSGAKSIGRKVAQKLNRILR